MNQHSQTPVPGTASPVARRDRIGITYGQKVFLYAAVPLVLAVLAISALVAYQAKALSDQEIEVLQRELIEAKQSELNNYMQLARNSINHIYGRAAPDDEEAKTRVTQILSAMLYGDDGFFFVYDYDGNNLVSPRQTYLIGKNWIDVTDRNGDAVVKTLIDRARKGGGYHRYVWPKPSTGEVADMYSYVIGLQDWRWAIGTGIFIDDVLAEVAQARAGTEARIRITFVWIAVITISALLLVFLSGLALNFRERRLADAKLKQLTQRIFDTQEEERSRVARELHDGISQILVGVRYALELTRRKLETGKPGAEDDLSKGRDGLQVAIAEVRRISRDLRPALLDDLGLGPALENLITEFGSRTGITTHFDTVVFRNRLEPDAKTALFRVAQEALTNVERHADATEVTVSIHGHRRGVTLRIADNGHGLPPAARQRAGSGLGLRNMQERVEHLDGTLRVTSGPSGTVVEARLPLKHLLAASDTDRSQKEPA
ncbi:cache domain-containing protein [Oceanomicrobium pacificus]|uniref:Oxygen sensor histidine kinase NreB n=1 Tax=Oceanomicrobium pacificus TaxID=2692916 RepID=A0A6B0TXH8_9RHOB|nr:cache domain-containing protein [Oceanomicrobium pacificus]MXU66178.1 histidine kinase [Oceanomicrobium pacificus]